jgi:hypothetical protein
MEFSEQNDGGVPPVPPIVPRIGEVSIGSEDEITQTGGKVEEINTDAIGVDPTLVVEDHSDEVSDAQPAEAAAADATAGEPAVDVPADQPAATGAEAARAVPDLSEAGLEVVAPHEGQEGPLVAKLTEPIESNGVVDAHGDFEDVGTEEVRERVAGAAEALIKAVKPDADMDDVYVSCFGEGYNPEDIDSADEHKLSVPSAVPKGGFRDSMDLDDDFKGDDSNTKNLLSREMQGLRDERADIGRSLLIDEEAQHEGFSILTADERAAALRRTEEIGQEIDALKRRQEEEPNIPVYYATPFKALRNNDVGEDNPLGYVGDLPEPGDPPTRAYLAFYDGDAIREAGITVTEKSDEQLRIHGTGRDIMPHCLAVMEVTFTGTEPPDEPEEW